MSDYKDKFIDWLNTNMPSIRYGDIPKFTWHSIRFEIDPSEAKAILNERYDGESSQKDQIKYFDEMLKKFGGQIKTISQFKEENNMSCLEYIKNERKSEEMINEVQDEVNRTVAFSRKIDSLKKTIDIKNWILKHKLDFEKTSKFMLNIFDKDDIIWVSDKPESLDISLEMKDMLSWADKNEKLSKYCFFSINPYKDGSARKKTEIKKFKYMLFEADNMTKQEQFVMWIDLIEAGLPVKIMTYTGNKSLHCLVKVPDWIKTLTEYEEYVEEVFEIINGLKADTIDKACKNPDRLSRIPFGVRCDLKTDFEYKEQQLFYIQTDDSKLQNDAKKIVREWADGIWKKKETTTDKTTEKDEIEEDELLWIFKDRDIISDIWQDGKHYHTLMKSSHFEDNGKIIESWENKEWHSEKYFYEYIQQILNDQYGRKFDIKDLKNIGVRHKTAEKFPFVGEKMPVKRDIVNTFIPGWLHQALNDDSIPNELNKPLEKLIINLFGDDERVRNWTLQWMREFMHTFTAITAPVFWEIPGSGKSMFAEAFGNAIGDWIKTPPKMDDIQFNAWQEYTVVIFEETSSGSKKDGKALGDFLKDALTSKFKTIEAKGKDPIKKLVKSCFIFNANISEQMAPVFIEDDDRRYTIVRNDDAVNLIDIWTKEDFENWDNGKYQMQLMKWIYNLPKDNSCNVHRGLDTVWKQEIIKMGKNNIEIALEEIVATYRGFISNADLIDMIRRDYGISTTSRANGSILRKLGYDSKLRKIAGNVKRGYIFNDKPVVETTDEFNKLLDV